MLIDALPYSDEGYEDEQVREAAARLIEEEVCLYFSFISNKVHCKRRIIPEIHSLRHRKLYM